MASVLTKNNLGLMKWPLYLCNFSMEHRISRIKVSLCLVQKVNRKSTGTSPQSHASNSFQQPFASEMKTHKPVMAKEVIEYLAPKENQVFLDMTFGAGGHSRKILEKSPKVKVLCLDRDPLAYDLAKKLQEEYPGRVIPLLGKFSELPKLLTNIKVPKNSLNGVLMDLGVSSMQFDTPERGFMLSADGPLDMRMDSDR
ncbi:12S rRNA N4-methylcytidine methyltransferase-like [Penaeus indicus]|uniref:12S rRNA N4-methylcytidine methyltransferase-like n=1 Tax=Penaeus indicus TaxID=29960 RepID=UPI00300C6AE6